MCWKAFVLCGGRVSFGSPQKKPKTLHSCAEYSASLRSIRHGAWRPFFVPQRNKGEIFILSPLTCRSKPALRQDGGKDSWLTNPRGRQTCLVTFIMYACLSLCEHTRNEVTSGHEGFGILILLSRLFVAFGVESPRGSQKTSESFLRERHLLVTFQWWKVTVNARRNERNSRALPFALYKN